MSIDETNDDVHVHTQHTHIHYIINYTLGSYHMWQTTYAKHIYNYNV